MKKLIVKLTGVAMLLGYSVSTVQAQDASNIINVVTSAVPFLRISPDARSGGMGDVGIATAPDANASFWNIGKAVFAKNKSSIGATYTPWLKDLGLNDVNLITIGGYYHLDELQAITGSIRYFSLGTIQFTDQIGNELSQFKPREFAVDAGYSRKLSNKLGLGIGLRYINSNLTGGLETGGTSSKAGTSVAGDIHVYHTSGKESGEGMNWGITLSNLGSKISYSNDAVTKDFIPANLGLGAAYTRVVDEANKLTFALDINKLMVPTPPSASDEQAVEDYHKQGVVSSWFKSFGDAPGGFKEELKEFQVSAGAEYWYNDQFAFRAGYFYEDATKGNRKYFTLGAGLKYNTFGLNFSYLLPSGNGINRNPLSNTLRFSLLFDFDDDGGTKK